MMQVHVTEICGRMSKKMEMTRKTDCTAHLRRLLPKHILHTTTVCQLQHRTAYSIDFLHQEEEREAQTLPQETHLQMCHVTDCKQTTAENIGQQGLPHLLRYVAVGSHTLFSDEAAVAATCSHAPTVGLRKATRVMRPSTLPKPPIRSRNHDTSPPAHDELAATGAAPKLGPYSGTKRGPQRVKVNSGPSRLEPPFWNQKMDPFWGPFFGRGTIFFHTQLMTEILRSEEHLPKDCENIPGHA